VPRCDASLIDEVAPPTAVRSPANFTLCFRPPRNRGPRRTTIAAPGRLLMPSATKEQIDSFNELQRKTASAESAAPYFEATGAIDVVVLLPKIRVPTLVMHARADGHVPFELGRQLAAEIPGAKFVALQRSNHVLLEHNPATQRLLEEVSLFLAN